MILKNSFYKVTHERLEDKTVYAAIDINKGHNVFKGHFPSQPIVPGVFQIQVIKELLSATTKKNLQLDSSKEIKFLRPISPVDFNNLEVEINIKDQSDEQISFSALIKNTEAVFLKYRGIYKVV